MFGAEAVVVAIAVWTQIIASFDACNLYPIFTVTLTASYQMLLLLFLSTFFCHFPFSHANFSRRLLIGNGKNITIKMVNTTLATRCCLELVLLPAACYQTVQNSYLHELPKALVLKKKIKIKKILSSQAATVASWNSTPAPAGKE